MAEDADALTTRYRHVHSRDRVLLLCGHDRSCPTWIEMLQKEQKNISLHIFRRKDVEPL